MGESMETDVLSHLYKLATEKKPTLAETFKDFNHFVSQRDEEIGGEVEEILERFYPSSNLGKLLKVKLVDKYKVSSYVVTLLRSDDNLYVARALKCNWFFENIDDPVAFVARTVPSLSLVVRMKVINKYAVHLKNAKTGDVLYREMKTKYGIKSALPLLPACSENFIRNELPNVKTPLAPNVTLALYEKYPQLATEYIKYLANGTKKHHCELQSYESTFVKLSQKDLKSFLNLFESELNIPYMRLGRRPTKNLLKNKTGEVLGNYNNYSRILVDKTFFSRLSLEQYKKLYVESLFPEKMSAMCAGIKREVFRSLNHVKAHQRSNLLLSAFKEKYNADPTSDEVLFKLDETWVDYLPVEAKKKWLENKIARCSDPAEQGRFLRQLPVNESVPRMKKLIESQSDATVRAALAAHLVSTVHINQSSATISDLFAYIVKRFRNEVVNFRRAVVDEMCKFQELFLELNDWTPIDDFINIIKLNGESSTFKYSLRKVFRYKIQSAFAGRGDVDVALKNYIEFEKSDSPDLSVEVVNLCHKLPCEGCYLAWLCRETSKMDFVDESSKLDFVLKLFSRLCQYNSEHEDVIEIDDWILDVVEAELKNEDTLQWKREGILNATKKHPVPRLLKYVKVFPEIMSESVVVKLLKENPDEILRHVQAVVQNALKANYGDYSGFFKKCRMYDAFGIASEVSQRCYEVLTVDPKELGDSAVMQPNAVRVMALLLQPAEFIKIVSSYFPDEKKIEGYSEEIRGRYEVQQALCKSFVDVSSPLEILPTIRRFAVGDFLKLVVGSLVSTCLKVPETKLVSLLEEWINCPVSLRKHFLRLTYDVAPTEYRVETFVRIFKTEKNTSLRLVLFKLLRHSFTELPGDDTFTTFKSVINQLTVDDEEALNLLIDVTGIEDDYISPFLELLWQLVETEWGTVLKDGKSKIVGLVDKNVLPTLNSGFCDTLVTHELTTKLPHSQPSDVLPVYLLWSPSHEVQMTRLEKISGILRPLIVNLWDASGFGGGRVYPIRQIVRNIVTSTCEMSKNDTFFVSPVLVLKALKKFLSSVIKPQDLLRESLCIDLAIHFDQNRTQTETPAFTKGIAQLYNSYVDTFGKDYGYSLVTALLEHVPSGRHVALAAELLSEPKSDPLNHLVAVEILKSETSCDEKDVPIYKPLVMQLSQSEHPTVQVALNEFLHSLTVDV